MPPCPYITLITDYLGALADDFGFKPFIILPFIGMLLGDIGMLFNYIFIEQLPLETFLFGNLISLFGGFTFYFLGTYGFAMKVSAPKARASTITRYGGFEVLGVILGTFLSPILLQEFSALTNYSIKIACTFIALIYVIFFVKEPQKSQAKPKLNFGLILKPIKDMFLAIFQVRPNGLQILIGHVSH